MMLVDIIKKPIYMSDLRKQIIWLYQNPVFPVVEDVAIGEWQARETQQSMRVIRDMEFMLNVPAFHDLPYRLYSWQQLCDPNLPWAEDHFQERVSGKPLNPAPSYEWWPFYKQGESWEITKQHQFSHTYPERMNVPHLRGVRYDYGNLEDVLELLYNNPLTRQAYLPIWFPEDTGAVHGERVPCSIGYLFTCQEDPDNVGKYWMDIHYQLRSCDFRRHFHNDMYMAGRLLQWVCEELSKERYNMVPRHLNVSIANLHIFKGEENFLK